MDLDNPDIDDDNPAAGPGPLQPLHVPPRAQPQQPPRNSDQALAQPPPQQATPPAHAAEPLAEPSAEGTASLPSLSSTPAHQPDTAQESANDHQFRLPASQLEAHHRLQNRAEADVALRGAVHRARRASYKRAPGPYDRPPNSNDADDNINVKMIMRRRVIKTRCQRTILITRLYIETYD